MPEPPKGFGSVGRALEGKLGKQVENNPSMRTITDEEIDAAENKLNRLKQGNVIINGRKKYPGFPVEISKQKLREVADYVNSPKGNEVAVWDKIAEGNYYGYCAYVHEATELKAIKNFIDMPESKHYGKSIDEVSDLERIATHGKALFEQYKLLRVYMLRRHEVKVNRLTQICYCDVWREYSFDGANSRKLSQYLKNERRKWYNRLSEKYPWDKDSRLKDVIRSIRNEEASEV